MDEIVLRLSGVGKKYPNVTALTDVSLTLSKGRVYALIGEDNSGKTTLFRLLTGLRKKTSGDIAILGMTGKKLTSARRQVGALVDSPTYYRELSIPQNLYAQARTLGRVDKTRINSLRTAMRLTQDVTGNRKISNCPVGLKQCFALISALLGSPRLLLLDDPFSGLDTEETGRFIALISDEIAQRDMTILMSSRYLSALYDFSTDFIFLDNGKVLLEISREELKSKLPDEPDADALNAFFAQLVKEARA